LLFTIELEYIDDEADASIKAVNDLGVGGCEEGYVSDCNLITLYPDGANATVHQSFERESTTTSSSIISSSSTSSLYETTTIIPTTTTTILVSTTTSSSSSTTTTAINTCAFKKIYGENSKEVKIVRYLRDNILSSVPGFKEITRLYYEWSRRIVRVMEEDEEFNKEIKEMIDGVLLLMREEVE